MVMGLLQPRYLRWLALDRWRSSRRRSPLRRSLWRIANRVSRIGSNAAV